MASIDARIKPRKSSTSGEVPTPGDLEVAELALNTADGSLYTKHTDGTIVQISGASGGLPGTVVYTDGIEWVKDASSTTPAANNWASNSSYANSLFIHVTSNNLGGVVTEIVQLQAGDNVDLHLDDVFVARDELVSITAVTADIYELEFQNASYWNHVTEHAAVGSVLTLGADVFASSTTQELPDFVLVQADGGTYKSIIADPVSLFGKDGNFEQHASLTWTGTAFEWQKPYVEVGDLQDVNITTAAPTDGQALVWDSENSEWIPGSTAGRIQDMDDFGLAPSEGTGDRYVTHNNSSPPAGRVYFPDPRDLYGQMYVSRYDADDPLNDSPFYTYLMANTSNNNNNVTAQIFLRAEGIHNESIEITVWRKQNYGSYIQLLWSYGVGTNGIAGFEGDLANLSTGTDVYLYFPGALEPLQAGDFLSWHQSGEFRPTTIGLNMLDDVDTITTLPTDGQVLVWDSQNSEWIPGSSAGGAVDSVNGQTGVVDLGIQDMDDYAPYVEDPLVRPNHTASNTPSPSTVFYAQAAGGYAAWAWDNGDTELTNAFGVLSIGDSFVYIHETSGQEVATTVRAASATYSAGSSWIVTEATYDNSFSSAGNITFKIAGYSGDNIALVDGEVLRWNTTDQKFRPASLSTVASSGSYNDLTDLPTTVDSDLGGLNDVDTTTNPPTDGQVLTWDQGQTSWVPGDASATTLGGLSDVNPNTASNGQVLTWSAADNEWTPADATDGLGGYSEVSLVTDSGGTLITTELGQLANLISIESDVAVWVCIYSSLVGMAADTTRSILDDPDPGSGVLAEFYLEDPQDLGTGSTVSVSPSISIYNADSPISDNIYIKTRTQGGANVSAALTLKTYVTVAGASAVASGGNGGVSERRTITATTSSLASQAAENVDFAGSGSAGSFLTVETSGAAWVTFYSSEASRTADATRNSTTAPSPGDGVLMEVITQGAEQAMVTPQQGFFNADNPLKDSLLAKVVNLSGSASTVEVTVEVLTYEH